MPDLLTNINNEDIYKKILAHFFDAEEAYKAGKNLCPYEYNNFTAIVI